MNSLSLFSFHFIKYLFVFQVKFQLLWFCTLFEVGGVNSSQFGSAALELCVDLILEAVDFICEEKNMSLT